MHNVLICSLSVTSKTTPTLPQQRLLLMQFNFNHLTPNGHFSGRTALLTSRCCIFYLFNKYTYWIF